MDASGVSRLQLAGEKSEGSMSVWERGNVSPGYTSLTFWGSPLECVHTRLMRTFEPLKVPSYTHPRSESESVHVFGSTFLVPHILWSSSSGSRSGTLPGSERSQRTCDGDERGMGKNGAEAHIVQIVDEPSQIFASQTWDSISVFVPAEEVDELAVKMRRSSVQISEFLQRIG